MKRLCGLVSFLPALFFLAFWAGAQQVKPVTLRVGMIPIVDCLDLFAAQEKGYFAEEGLKVELTPMAGGAAILPALAGGSLDIGYSAVITTLLAVDKGFDFVIVADGAYEPTSPPFTGYVVVRKDSGITSPRDLERKKIGINLMKNIADLSIMEKVRLAGGDASSITWVEIPFPQMAPAIINKQVDAGVLVEPFYTMVKNDPNLKVLFYNLHDVRSGMMVANWVTTKRWVSTHGEVAERFARAMGRASDYLNNNPKEARNIVPKYARLSPELAETIGIKRFGRSVKLEELQWVADLLVRYGLIKKGLDVKEVVSKTAR